MDRRIIEIREDACTGCGQCVNACPYADLQLKGGKAHLENQEYCDGLGECIPSCPQDALYLAVEDAMPFCQEAAEHHALLGHHHPKRLDVR